MRGDKPLVAVLGLAGWHEMGKPGFGSHYSRGPLDLDQVAAPILIDKSEAMGSNDPAEFKKWWNLPSLDCGLADDNVRDMLEGCIGCDGTTDGHKWSGETVSSCASVGVNVYVELCRRAGYKVTKR